MAGSRNSRVGRHAAIVAADRVKLLLAVVEEDAFLSEVLTTADNTISIVSQSRPGPDESAGTGARGGAQPTALGPAYHSAKARARRAGMSAAIARCRPLGRA